MFNRVLVSLAVFILQICCNMSVPIEMFFPGEAIRRPDHRSTPIRTPVVFDDPAPAADISETLPVFFLNEDISPQASSLPSSTLNDVNHIGESNQRRFSKQPTGISHPLRDSSHKIIFPTTSTPDPSPVNEHSGSGDGGLLFPDFVHDPSSSPKDVLIGLLNDNSTECDIDLGWIPINGSCERLLARSSCAEGEWLVYENESFRCQERPCPWEQVLLNGQCVSVRSFDVCPRGHILYVDLTGQASCDCQHGYVYGPTSGQCYAQYTQGPCNHGHYVVIDSEFGSVKCIPNKCNLNGWIHHEPTNGCYLKLYDGFCDEKGMMIDEVNRTVSCEDVLPFNIFNTPRLNKCPPGSLRDRVNRCRAYLPRIPVASTFPKAKYGACPPGYTRDPLGTCKKLFNLFAS